MIDENINLPEINDGEDKSSILANRIRKNYRHIRKWAKRTNTDCFRIYDKEIRQYPMAIDFYAGRFCVHYFSHSTDDAEPPADLKQETLSALATVFDVKSQSVFWRTRAKTKLTRQYEKNNQSKEFFPVTEFGIQFQVNLVDYLDTGLFLDHRETRAIVASLSTGKRVLNLFAYTCSFSVHAAMAGAIFTKSVDMSNTYCAWGRANFILNSIAPENHPIIRADCLKFLDQELLSHAKYDVIVIDPPTISRSKKMDEMFDVQQAYPKLIMQSLNLLSPNGVIIFSTNSRKFLFDDSLFSNCQIQEISHKTLPVDFQDPKIHRCWKITKG